MHETLHSIPVIFFSITDILFNIIRTIISIESKPITKITSFNLIPEYKTGTLGSVEYINASPTQSIIINLAPIVAWILIIFLAEYLGYILLNYTHIIIPDITILSNNNTLLVDGLFILISIQLLLAGKLSTTDMKNIFRGIATVEFILLILAIYTTQWIYKNGYRDILDYVINLISKLS